VKRNAYRSFGPGLPPHAHLRRLLLLLTEIKDGLLGVAGGSGRSVL
jgi:hypothetical protein